MEIISAITAVALGCYAIYASSRMSYWRGKFEESDESGWRNEAMFWRYIYNADAAKWVEDDEASAVNQSDDIVQNTSSCK